MAASFASKLDILNIFRPLLLKQPTQGYMHSFLLKSLKFNFVIAALLIAEMTATATIHVIRVRDSSTQFVPQYDGPILLGDTIQWLPMDVPMMFHTITSTDIPENAVPFDAQWFAPVDTFFQYIPTEIGLYNYVCVPHEALGMIDSFIVEGPLSTDTGEENDGVRLFPNPVLDRIYINEANRFDHYKIYTLDGQLVTSGKRTSDNIPVDALTHGVYVIELTGEHRILQKFVKE